MIFKENCVLINYTFFLMRGGFWPQCNTSWKMLSDKGDWPVEEGGGLRQHGYPSHVALRFYFIVTYLVFNQLFQNFYSFSLNSLTFGEENKLSSDLFHFSSLLIVNTHKL